MEHVLGLAVPDGFARLRKRPGDEPGSSRFAMRTPGSFAYLETREIPSEQAMPWNDDRAIVDGVHGALADDQGLVEVGSGSDPEGGKFVFTVVKSRLEPAGAAYTLVFERSAGDGPVVQARAVVNEEGVTGRRDAAAFELALRAGYASSADDPQWRRDPYDPGRRSGFLATAADLRDFDELFPDHPVSVVHRLLDLWTGGEWRDF